MVDMSTYQPATGSSLRVELAGPVVTIWLSDPARRNALTPAMTSAAVAALCAAEADPAIGAVIVAADGPDFCAGADLSLLRRQASDPLTDEALDELDAIYEMFTAFRGSALPTISAVQGRVLGAGVNVALMCDLCVVSEGAVFRGFGASGVHPGGGHIAMWARLSTLGLAGGVLFNQEISAARAVELGLAWSMVEEAALHREAGNLAAAAGADPALTRRVVRTVRRVAPHAEQVALSTVAERTSQLWSLSRRFVGADA
jgi:enoyl-CoA hydratase